MSLLRHAATVLLAAALAACGSTSAPAPEREPEPAVEREPEPAAATGAPQEDAEEAPAPAQDEPDAERPLANTIRWTTATELDNFGFDVYRALGPDGPWEKITDEVIEGAGTSDEPHAYRFVDDRIEPDTVYYYYVESISMSGFRERFTPVGKAPPKPAPADRDDG